jgi:hypothetical protein
MEQLAAIQAAQNQGNSPQMMTLRQVSQLRLLPYRLLRSLVKSGRLPCVYSGRVAYINVNTLKDMLTSGTGAIFERNESWWIKDGR